MIAPLALALLVEILLIINAGGLGTFVARLFEPNPALITLPADWEDHTAGNESMPGTGSLPFNIYFTDPSRAQGKNQRGGLDQVLTAFIGTAKTSVDMAAYQLDLVNVTGALLDARKRKVAVRVVTDIDVLNDPKENSSFNQLRAAGISVVAGNADAIMHDKFVVVDSDLVWTGSWNFTTDDTYHYNNNAMIIRSRDLARNYTVAFEKMFVHHRFGGAKQPGGTTARLNINGIPVESYFSPEDRPADKITARLRQAKESIYFMAFSFTHDGMGQAVRDAAWAGVTVQGVFEAAGSDTEFSERSKMQAMDMDVLVDGNPYLMHHKVFIIDEETVVVGSLNFSDNANRENDENVLIIDDARVAQAYLAEFHKVYAQAREAGH